MRSMWLAVDEAPELAAADKPGDRAKHKKRCMDMGAMRKRFASCSAVLCL